MNKLIIFGIIIIIAVTSSIILFTPIPSNQEDIIEEVTIPSNQEDIIEEITILKCQPQEQNNTFSVGNDKITFASNRDENWEIYTMNADGSDQTRLTTKSFDNLFPSWSPDGTQIVFASDRDGNFEIYTMNADGSEQTRLTNNEFSDKNPDW